LSKPRITQNEKSANLQSKIKSLNNETSMKTIKGLYSVTDKNISAHICQQTNYMHFKKVACKVKQLFSQLRTYNTSETTIKLNTYNSLDGHCRCRNSKETVRDHKPCYFSDTSG
jgi:hypothetical protein